jgi:hypothetical protein
VVFLQSGLWITGGPISLCVAQQPAPQPAERPAQPQLLGNRFVDATFGFSLRPFARGNINQFKIPDPLGGYQLVEFVHQERPWMLLVCLDTTTEPLRPEEFTAALQRFWTARYDEVEARHEATRVIGARPGATWSGRTVERVARWAMWEGVVQVRPQEFFRIALKMPVYEEHLGEALFDVILDSFEVVRSEVGSQTIDEALARGRSLLERGPDLKLLEHLDPEASILIRRGSQDIGYAHVTEKVETHGGKQGVRISERGWLFLEKGAAHRMINDYFVSADLQSAMFEMRLRIIQPARDDLPAMVIDQVEKGIRESDKLLLSYTEQPGDLTLANRTLELSPTYIPLALQRMLPRLVPLETPELYAFSSYNTLRKSLVLHTYRVLDAAGIPGSPPAGAAYFVEDAEGMVPPGSMIFLDRQAHILRVRAGEDTLTRTGRATIDTLFGTRRAQAEALLARLENKP